MNLNVYPQLPPPWQYILVRVCYVGIFLSTKMYDDVAFYSIESQIKFHTIIICISNHMSKDNFFSSSSLNNITSLYICSVWQLCGWLFGWGVRVGFVLNTFRNTHSKPIIIRIYFYACWILIYLLNKCKKDTHARILRTRGTAK